MDRTLPVYIPTGVSLRAADRWEIVRDALVDQGWTNVRPAPMPSMAFIPASHRREVRHG
jgi:hypothetical protein